jgi:SAM-dependent methyltransferase
VTFGTPVPSTEFYDALASRYDALFLAPHRRAYDQLAWEFVLPLLPGHSSVIVDVGCGTARWTRQLVDLGYHVVGIEPAPSMAAIARARLAGTGAELIQSSIEAADLGNSTADVVLAIGSLQYTSEPEEVVQRLGRLLRPGGRLIVLVDSWVALLVELLAADKVEEARERRRTRVGHWVLNGRQVTQHLFDRRRLEHGFERAGLIDISIRGLLVGASIHGRDRLSARLERHWDEQYALERQLANIEVLADFGKQLLGVARAPV